MSLNATLVDLEGRATVHVEVLANVTKPETRGAVQSNKFNFTFGVAANVDGSGPALLGKEIELRRVRISNCDAPPGQVPLENACTQ